jgi:hypothetical protein
VRRNASQHACEKGLRLLKCKAQVGVTQFVQVSLCAPSSKRQRRIGSRGQHQVQLERQMLNQQVEQGMHLAGVNEVIIIEHKQYIVRHIGQIIEEQGGNFTR